MFYLKQKKKYMPGISILIDKMMIKRKIANSFWKFGLDNIFYFYKKGIFFS